MKRRVFRRKRRSFKKKSKPARAGRRMQRMAMSFVKKKYTTVVPLRVAAGNASVEFTISHIGGRNVTTPASTQVITDANPDGMLISDMALYQFFKISGVAFKLFWPEGTEAETTPV